MSRRVIPNNKSKLVKGEVKATGCHVCKAHGKSTQMVDSHNFRDVRGKVCCPTMLENVCSKCGVKGHFQSGCTGPKEKKAFQDKVTEREDKKEKVAVPPINPFDALAGDDSDQDDAPPANVTIHKPMSRTARLRMNWAVDALAGDDSDEDDAPPANVTIRTTLSRAARLRLNWADDSESDEE